VGHSDKSFDEGATCAPPSPTNLQRSEIAPMGLRTVLLEAGSPGDDEAVVFLHGHPGSGRDWEPLLEQTGRFARALAFDLPGYGKSDKPKDWDYSIGTYGTYLAATLNVLNVTRVHLVMHDLGGGAGLAWAAAHPEAFASAVIIDTGVLIGFRWHPLARAIRTPGLGEVFAALTNRPSFRAVMRYYNPQPRKLPRWYVERLWEDYDRRTRTAVMRMYRSAPPTGFERLAPVFSQLDVPALVLWGRHDPACPVEQAELQRRSFPSANVVVLEDSGHWPFIDDREGAASHIIPFLERQLTRSESVVARQMPQTRVIHSQMEAP
jgi:pimeloyl-ACP methyl ester carboxylesterase